MDSSSKQLSTRTKGLADPLRAQIYRRLQRSASSPVRVAAEVGRPIASVAYHFKVLAGAGLIEQVHTRAVRGAIEHFYAVAERDVAEVRALRLSAERWQWLLRLIREMDDDEDGDQVMLLVHR
jgi:DNA-binding transcriptional ArsR family regulator